MADFDNDLFDVFDEANDSVIEVIPVPPEATEVTPDDDVEIIQRSEPSTTRKRESELVDAEPDAKKVKSDSLLDDINLEELVTQIKIHKIETIESCTHEVAVPPNHTYIPLEVNPNLIPAKEYKFILDPFQKEAILCIENNQSVLVSAHTSAGKTVVAEYAIACSLREKQRVIYTTPIKALSNQKYREFFEEFKDVGLVTGDVTINPTASVLIMTTEILRNMLYRGSEVMREVGWVIFDEIHYMRDKERGVVWEETLILLPDNVHYVFLSATIPNARQFAEWVAHLHHQPCHVVYTDYRPTPLEHFIFPAGGDGIHLVVDIEGRFKDDNFNRAMSVLQNSGDASKGDQKGRRGGARSGSGETTNIFKMVKMIMERNFAPVIIFSFSKKDCEGYALQLSKLDFNTNQEKNLVDEVFKNAIDVLSEEDRSLPQVVSLLPLLKRGIGIHHGGLLPILKETVEILFGEGLIKALFATETFAMGLNMPARTVLFTAPRKFDGKDFRWITSGEYIQMSGRAGRRGLDEKGIVILMIDEQVSPTVGKEIVQGKPDAINSAFHLTYNMVLNLLRVEEINPEYMLERSFYQFQNQACIPSLYDKVKELQNNYDAIVIDNYNQISSYHDIREQLERLNTDYRKYITTPQYLLPFLQPGRMIKIKNDTHAFDWGIVINFKKKNSKNPKEKSTLIVDTLLHVSKNSKEGSPIPCGENEDGDVEVVPVLHTLITEVSSLRVVLPKDLRPSDNRKSVLKTIREVKKRCNYVIPLLNPITEMQINDSTFKDIYNKIEILEKKLKSHPLHEDKNLEKLYNEYLKKEEIGGQLKDAKNELKQAKSVLQMDELKCRKRVLRRMAYCTAADVIELKGRVACELNGADELLLTEMIFNGLFNALNVPQLAALLSCFVCDEKSNEMPKSTNELSGPLRQMQDLARRIAKVSSEATLDLDEDKYVERFKPYLMDVVYAWCKGANFSQICKLTQIYEGSIIRCMRRLEEILRQLSQAAKNIGNTDLENKFSEAIKILKRDIVFAASLYL